MAERRMFAKSIIDSARFLRMPATSRLLYYDLGMAADDDGVVEAFTVMRTTGAVEDDLRVLVSKGFVTVLNDDLVSYITDWKRNNLIKKDRYRPSVYTDLLVQISNGTQPEPIWNPTGTQPEPQVRLGKDRLGKDRLGYISAPTSGEPEPENTKEPAVFELILNGGIKHPITQSQIDRWTEAYPGVDVYQALRSMGAWLEANPAKRKTARGINRFIVNWLDRDQNSGKNPRKGGVNNGTSGNTSSVWDAGMV